MAHNHHRSARPAEVHLHNRVRGIPRGAPVLRTRPILQRQRDGVDEGIRWIGDVPQLLAGAAPTSCRVPVGYANAASARRTGAKMALAGPLRADRTLDDVTDSIGGLVDVADGRVCQADELPRRIAEWQCVLVAIELAVFNAGMHMSPASLAAA